MDCFDPAWSCAEEGVPSVGTGNRSRKLGAPQPKRSSDASSGRERLARNMNDPGSS